MTESTRDRMLDSTIRMLAAGGYQGASFSTVLERANAPRGSIYHHFPGGKDELVSRAIERSWERTAAHLESLRGGPATDVVAGFVALWRALLVRADFEVGCSVLAVTVSAADADIRIRAGDIFGAWQQLLAELLVSGGVPADRSKSLANLLLAACEGAVVLARAQRSTEPLDAVERELLPLVAVSPQA